MGKKYVVESDFDDLHGNADEAPDLELDLSDSENPIIQAALDGDDKDADWTPPKEDDEEEDKDDQEDSDGEDDDEDQDDTDDEDSDEDETDDDEEDGEDEDSDDDEDEDEDDVKYSKKVRARIAREREARRRDKEDSDRRIRKMEKKLELRDARDDFSRAEKEAEAKLRKLRKQKVEAIDEGDTSKQVDIDDQILDIKADVKTKQIELKNAEASIDDDDDSDSNSGTPAEGQKWLSKYPQFHSNSQFRNVVLLTDKAVAARGFDKDSPEYYEEIEKILRPQFPAIIKKKSTKVTNKRTVKKKRSAVGSTTKPGTRRKTRSRRGVVRLTKQDQVNMQTFGMDPTNPADAKAWAESKGSS